MNKRARRQLVMAKRYAKLDQRKQESRQAKEQNKWFEAEINFILGQDHPMAKIARELVGAWGRSDHERINSWHKDNPELSSEMKAFMAQAQKDFREGHR